MKTVAILFARADSIYKTLDGCDVWDIERDARKFTGGMPIVAHPPCRAWGRLRYFAKPRPDEKDLARWAVSQIRQHGGVLEHPASSSLWLDQGLPRPGSVGDSYGGFSISVLQKWWGHPCDKSTWLYICGCAPKDVPATPLLMHDATHIVSSSLVRKGHPRWKPHLSKEDREKTPPAFAEWLVELARRCTPPTLDATLRNGRI